MEKTSNYSLPQWEAIDPVCREDFNAAMASIDTAIHSASYVIGSYTGNGVTMADGGQTIELGFRPRFLLISKGWYALTAVPATTYMAGEYLADNAAYVFAWTDTGFKVGLYGSSSISKLNTAGETYGFVAFR